MLGLESTRNNMLNGAKDTLAASDCVAAYQRWGDMNAAG